MSLGAAFGLAVLVVVTMFALVFVLAGVETRMFDDVMVDPEPEETPAPALEVAPELSQAA